MLLFAYTYQSYIDGRYHLQSTNLANILKTYFLVTYEPQTMGDALAKQYSGSPAHQKVRLKLLYT